MLVIEVAEELGYAVLEASNAVGALKLLVSDIAIDPLVSDIGLPGRLNGQQAADIAVGKRSDLKVLFITGYAENAAFGHGHLASGMQVLTKPFAMDELGRRVQDIISVGDSHDLKGRRRDRHWPADLAWI